MLAKLLMSRLGEQFMMGKAGQNLDRWMVRRVGVSYVTWAHAVATNVPYRSALLLTTIGRKSGLPRDVVLPYFRVADELAVIGSHGGSDVDPSWIANIAVNPNISVCIGRRKHQAVARFAADEERALLYLRARSMTDNYTEYERRTKRVIPVVLIRMIKKDQSNAH